jgi:hypothetical protein
VSGKVVNVPSSGVVTIEYNEFTVPSILSVNNAPGTDAEAFDQTLQRTTGSPKSYLCALYDQFGTPLGAASMLIAVSGNNLEFSDTSLSDVAAPGDIIIMGFATYAFTTYPNDIEACWDAFQADYSGSLSGSADFAYPWVR